MSLPYYTYHIKIDNSQVCSEQRGLEGEVLATDHSEIDAQELKVLSEITRNGKIAPEDTQTWGQKLFSVLFAARPSIAFLDLYNRVSHENGFSDKKRFLRLELELAENYQDLMKLPWESLCYPLFDADLAWLGAIPQLTLVRWIARKDAQTSLRLPANDRLRIALALTEPILESSHATLQENIRNVLTSFLEVELTIIQASLEAIDNVLEHQRPHIFHLICRAKASNVKGQHIEQVELLSSKNKLAWFTASGFCKAFQRYRPRIVFLQPSEQMSSKEGQVFTAIASQLMRYGVPATITMQYKIANEQVKRFVETFYVRLLKGESVDKAVQEGRCSLERLGQDPQYHRTWWSFIAPTLFMSVQDGQLLSTGQQLEPLSLPKQEVITAFPSDKVPSTPIFFPSTAEATDLPIIFSSIAQAPPPKQITPHEERTFSASITAPGQREKIPQVVPPPYGAQTIRPSSLYAFQVNTGQKQVDYQQPFDLGMIWGINRSSFIGIIAAQEQEDRSLYTHLVSVERALYEAMDEQQQLLPVRWWIQVHTRHFPNGPPTLADVWNAATEQGDNRVAYLREYGLPPRIMPAIIIPIPASILESGRALGTYRAWCRRLLQHPCFPHEELAIIFQVNAPASHSVLRGMCHLAEELKRIPEVQDLPIEVMALDHFTREKKSVVSQNVYKRAPGICFYAWMKQITQTETYNAHQRELSDRFRYVLSVFAEIQTHIDQSLEYYSAQELVADIDNSIRSPSPDEHKLDSELLSLVKICLPEHLPSLIEAYARSTRRQARRTALYIAANSADAETLLDAWIIGNNEVWYKGNDTDLARFLSEEDIYANHADVGFVEKLALALIRNYGNMSSEQRAVIEQCMDQLSQDQWLNKGIEAVWRLCHDIVTSKASQATDLYTFFFQESECSKEYIYPAIQAKIQVNDLMPIASLRPFLHLMCFDLWWLLMATPPTRERILELLSLAEKQRVVLGCCSAEEWRRTYKEDQNLRNEIRDCRHMRDLYFRAAAGD